jgi:hypothetical protein
MGNPIENGSGKDRKGRFTKGHSLSKGKHKVEFIEKARELKSNLLKRQEN